MNKNIKKCEFPTLYENINDHSTLYSNSFNSEDNCNLNLDKIFNCSECVRCENCQATVDHRNSKSRSRPERTDQAEPQPQPGILDIYNNSTSWLQKMQAMEMIENGGDILSHQGYPNNTMIANQLASNIKMAVDKNDRGSKIRPPSSVLEKFFGFNHGNFKLPVR